MITETIKRQSDELQAMPLDREAFESWLKLQPADRFFDPGSVHGCPLACYLKATGLPSAWVGYDSRIKQSHVWTGSETMILPGWTYAFQWAISNEREIKAPEALELLHGLPKEKGDTDEPAVAPPGQHLAEPG